MLVRVLHAHDIEAKIKSCVQRLGQYIDNFVVSDPTVISYFNNSGLFAIGRDHNWDRSRIKGERKLMIVLI